MNQTRILTHLHTLTLTLRVHHDSALPQCFGVRVSLLAAARSADGEHKAHCEKDEGDSASPKSWSARNSLQVSIRAGLRRVVQWVLPSFERAKGAD